MRIRLGAGYLVPGLLGFLVLSGCGSAVGPDLLSTKTAVPVRLESSKLTWQEEWEKTKSLAIAEGSLLISGSAGPALRDPLTRAFREKYGVNLDWLSSRGDEVVQRIFAEQRAGIYAVDIYLSGATLVPTLRGQNAVQSLDPVLILPEVLDKKAWWGGDLIFLDKEHTWVGLLAYPNPPIFVNTDLVKPGEARSWRELLDPRWKGKMVLYRPTTGAGLSWAYSVSEVIMYPDYLRQFAKQEPIVLGDSRQQSEWIARGKYPVAVAARTENTDEFMKLGAPVQLVTPTEGVELVAGAGGLSLLTKAPHPNAAKLFINWALTREGATLFSKLIGGQSARLDVPTDFLEPSVVRQPGGKYFNLVTEDHYLKKSAFAKVAEQIFAPLMK